MAKLFVRFLFVFAAVATANECLDEINKYRNMAGKGSLSLCDEKYQQQAQQDAEYDQNNGFHKSLSHFDARSFCPPMGTKGGGIDQNEFLATSDFVSSCTWDKVMACFYNEGTDYHNDCCRTADTTAHRDALLGDHVCASCGLATGETNMYTNNFCTRNQAFTTLSAATECMDSLNKYRGMAGKASLPPCADKYQQQAQQDAEYDQTNGYHNSLSHFDARSFCPPMGTKGGGIDQNEYLASSDFVSSCTWDKVMACFYNEGTDFHNDCCRTADTTAHRDAMLGDHECASCGLATGDTNMYTNNFCTRNQLAINATIVV